MRANHVAPMAAAVLVASLATTPAAARIKCWVNDDGVRECGNTVPPEYSRKAHQELTEQGVTVKESQRAKTPEELRREQEARARAAREREAMRIRAKTDRVLLATFTTEEDLIRTRDSQFSALDIRIKNLTRAVDKLKRKREALRAEAARQELSGKTVSAQLKSSIARVNKRIEDQLATIERHHREKVELSQRYDADLARYRELKAGKPIGAP